MLKAKVAVKAEAVVKTETDPFSYGKCIMVTVRWTGARLDRPQEESWALKPTQTKLAKRLAACIEAQAYRAAPEIKRDIYGKTYVACNWGLTGKSLNADLTRKGF